MKICTRCGAHKPKEDYYKNKGSRDGRLSICNTCVGVRQRAYVLANADEVSRKMKIYHQQNREKLLTQQRAYKARNKERLADLKREKETGFSRELFQAAIKHQNGKCPICLRELADLPPQQQHADHCHATGNPRGVLCQKCNTVLGVFRDDISALHRAIQYLELPTTLKMLL